MKKMRENKKWADIPVVVVSNSASPEKVHTMLALGAKKYLLKDHMTVATLDPQPIDPNAKPQGKPHTH